MQRFEVNMSAFSERRVAPLETRALAGGEVRLAIDFFAFTANNMTYAAAGEALGYWQFFPVAEDGPWGVIPVWGFADVRESQCAEVQVGERLYGYFPPADELIIKPTKPGPGVLFDGSEHRQVLPPLYNRYQRGHKAPDKGLIERLQALLGPLYNTAYCLWDQLAENNWYGAQQIILVSASSKTSLGLAQAIADDDQAPPVVGLTSAGNREFVQGVGLYDAVLSYDDIASLDRVASVVVDMAGNQDTAQALRKHLGDQLNYYISVGITHWDKAGNGLGGKRERHEWFFAPTYMLERTAALEPGEFPRRAQAFVKGAAANAMAWLTLDEVSGLDALAERYDNICAGAMNPAEGLICKL